jgi:homogentisate 1,2-dioxygenase
VMIDARDPLDVAEGAAAVENLRYVESWKAAPTPL